MNVTYEGVVEWKGKVFPNIRRHSNVVSHKNFAGHLGGGEFIDFTKKKKDHLFVVGYLGRNKVQTGMWELKCDCGNIFNMTTPNIKKMLAGKFERTMMCGKCDYIEYLKEQENEHK